MAINFLTPDQISVQYLTHLKTLKPEVDTSQTDSDWYIRSRVVGGVVSGAYADQRKIADDAFPQSARRDALAKWLQLLFNSDFKQPTQSSGTAAVTGTNGSVIPANTQFLYNPNGNTYQSTAVVTLVGTTGEVPITSIASGQDQNLLKDAALVISSPPSGINSAAVALTNIGGARNLETNEEASARVLARLQNPPAGGNEADYKAFAKAADASVIDVNVIRFIFGLGTVGLIVTAGTTDIDAAVTNGDPVIRTPSAELIQKVNDYVDAINPLTDCVHTFGPNVIYVPAVVKVRYAEGDDDTIPAGQTLTQKQLVQREMRRAIYKTPPGGRRFGSQGFVLASELEEVLDAGLSAPPYTEGNFAQILVDRQVQDLSTSGPNFALGVRDMAEPGAITVMSF